MAPKRNGKSKAAAPLVVERAVAASSDRIWDTLALPPPEVRSTEDVLDLLGDVAEVLWTLHTKTIEAVSTDLVGLLIFDARERVRACVEALRTGRFPTFSDQRDRDGDWVRAARDVLGVEHDAEEYKTAAAELFLRLADEHGQVAAAREAEEAEEQRKCGAPEHCAAGGRCGEIAAGATR